MCVGGFFFGGWGGGVVGLLVPLQLARDINNIYVIYVSELAKQKLIIQIQNRLSSKLKSMCVGGGGSVSSYHVIQRKKKSVSKKGKFVRICTYINL